MEYYRIYSQKIKSWGKHMEFRKIIIYILHKKVQQSRKIEEKENDRKEKRQSLKFIFYR